MNVVCGNCRFYREERKWDGYCQRTHPGDSPFGFPVVSSYAWCGEWVSNDHFCYTILREVVLTHEWPEKKDK